MKVLLVEDEPRFAATMSMGLRAEGFVVVHAANGYWVRHWRGSCDSTATCRYPTG